MNLTDFDVCDDAIKYKELLLIDRKSSYLVGDIEAYLNEDKEFIFKLGVIFDGKEFYSFFTLKDMFSFMHFHKKKKIYFHNLNFDFIFFLRELNIGFDVDVIQSGNMILSVNCNTVEFLNSLSILPMSLKKIVQNFLGINWEEWENEKGNVLKLEEDVLEEYCRRDCFLTYVAINKFDSMIQENYGIKKYLTIPSLALKVFNKKFIDEDVYKRTFHVKNRNSFFNEGYYFGGHTEKFINGKYEYENVNYYDVNSLYPSVMKDLEVNEGGFTMISPTMENMLKEFKQGNIFYIDCDIFVTEENMRIFPTFDEDKHSNYYKFGLNRVKISDISVKFLNDNGWLGNIVKINGLVVCKSKVKNNIFKDFVETNYALRKSDIENEIIYKLFLNGLYGKYGQKMRQKTYVINPVKKKVENQKSVTVYDDLNFLHEGESDLDRRTLKHSRFDIAGRITESARVLMATYRIMIKSKGGRIFYQDTDSIQGDFDLEKLGLGNIFCNKTLGLLKKENDKEGLLKGVIIGQKVYDLGSGFSASKGVKNMYSRDYINLSRALFNRNILRSDDRLVKFFVKKEFNRLDDVRENALFYNTRFTQTKTFLKRGFFGIQLVPHYITNLRERIDGEVFNSKVEELELYYTNKFKQEFIENRV